ncbi:MAG: hypothetical protein ABJF01_19800 [bacterium]
MARVKQQPWQTVPYIRANGGCDVLDYLDRLRERKLRSWLHFEELRKQIIARGPFDVGPPYWQAVGDSLFEISWGHNRVYCSVEGQRIVMMYAAVYKLWPKFRSADRRKCESGRDDVRSAAYDQEQRELKYLAFCQRRGKDGSL